MATGGFHDWWRRIGSLSLTTPEWAVLTTLAAHGDWTTGEGCYPSVDTIAETTGLGVRTVKRALHSLACSVGPGRSCGDPRCNHRGLLVIQKIATRYRPTTYALRLDEQAVQSHLPEVGIMERRAAAIRRGAPRSIDRPA